MEDRCLIDQQIVVLVEQELVQELQELVLVHQFVLQMELGLGTFLLIFFEFLFEFILFIIEIRYTDPLNGISSDRSWLMLPKMAY